MTVTQTVLAVGSAFALPISGFFVWWHRSQTAQTAKLGEQSASIAELRVALVGIDGQNGMRGELRQQAAEVKELGRHVREHATMVQTHIGKADRAERIAEHAREVADDVKADLADHLRTHNLPGGLPTLYDRRRSS